MGAFYVSCSIEHTVRRTKSAVVPKVLVDTGSECTWVSTSILERLGIKREKKDLEFVMANGQHITRDVGIAILRAADFKTVDEVVFALPGDLTLVGVRTLEGFNAIVDLRRRCLVAAGPMPAAVA